LPDLRATLTAPDPISIFKDGKSSLDWFIDDFETQYPGTVDDERSRWNEIL